MTDGGRETFALLSLDMHLLTNELVYFVLNLVCVVFKIDSDSWLAYVGLLLDFDLVKA